MNQILLERKPTAIKKEIKIVLNQNGYKRAKLDEAEDYDGRALTSTIPVEDYKYIQDKKRVYHSQVLLRIPVHTTNLRNTTEF